MGVQHAARILELETAWFVNAVQFESDQGALEDRVNVLGTVGARDDQQWPDVEVLAPIGVTEGAATDAQYTCAVDDVVWLDPIQM